MFLQDSLTKVKKRLLPYSCLLSSVHNSLGGYYGFSFFGCSKLRHTTNSLVSTFNCFSRRHVFLCLLVCYQQKQ